MVDAELSWPTSPHELHLPLNRHWDVCSVVTKNYFFFRSRSRLSSGEVASLTTRRKLIRRTDTEPITWTGKGELHLFKNFSKLLADWNGLGVGFLVV